MAFVVEKHDCVMLGRNDSVNEEKYLKSLEKVNWEGISKVFLKKDSGFLVCGVNIWDEIVHPGRLVTLQDCKIICDECLNDISLNTLLDSGQIKSDSLIIYPRDEDNFALPLSKFIHDICLTSYQFDFDGLFELVNLGLMGKSAIHNGKPCFLMWSRPTDDGLMKISRYDSQKLGQNLEAVVKMSDLKFVYDN